MPAKADKKERRGVVPPLFAIKAMFSGSLVFFVLNKIKITGSMEIKLARFSRNTSSCMDRIRWHKPIGTRFHNGSIFLILERIGHRAFNHYTVIRAGMRVKRRLKFRWKFPKGTMRCFAKISPGRSKFDRRVDVDEFERFRWLNGILGRIKVR